MTRYFDKDFFKFLFKFVAIVAVSLAVIFVTQAYESGSESEPGVNIATP